MATRQRPLRPLAMPRSWMPWVLTCCALGYATGARAQAVAPTRENGYEVRRWQTRQPALADSVGAKTTDHETRQGVAPETAGSSRNLVMTVGGFVKKCPTANGDVAGTFEYQLTADEVVPGDGGTTGTRYSHRLDARLEGHVGDDGKLVDVAIAGEFTRERSGAPTERRQLSRQTFRPGAGGEPDYAAMRRTVEMTGELAFANAILMAGGFYKEAEAAWHRPNECVELFFDPSSDTRALAPGESVEVGASLHTLADGAIVGGATLHAQAIGGAGTVTPSQGKTPPDTAVIFTFTAPSAARPPTGFEVATLSRAGYAQARWRSLEALTLTIENRIVGRRDTPHAIGGMAIFSGDVRFEVKLSSAPSRRGRFRGSTSTVRQLTVDHITPRCKGSGVQRERWDVYADIDAATETLRLEIEHLPLSGEGFWVCDGHRDELDVFVTTYFVEESPLTMSARSGTRQEFSLTAWESRETLVVTIP